MEQRAANGSSGPPSGIVWLLSGVEATTWFLRGAVCGLRAGGVTAEIRIFPWQVPVISIVNLFLTGRCRRRAASLASRIGEHLARNPESPVDVVGYSGGGAAALWTAEALPAGASLRNLILVHPAVSPHYDLTPALGRVRGRLVNFCSRTDRFLLGWGTTLLGTMDRWHGSAAGRVGFDPQTAIGDARLRSRFEQRMWDGAMFARYGRLANHLRVLTAAWNREQVAPYLRGPPDVRSTADHASRAGVSDAAVS